MGIFRRLFVRSRNVITRRRGNARLQEELEQHLALQTAANMRAGMPPDEARRQATLKLGGAVAIEEQYHAEEGLPFFELLGQDSLYAARRLCKSPGLTSIVVLTLALGIGANAAIFSVVHAVLVRPLAYDRPSQLLSMSEDNRDAKVSGAGLAWTSFQELQRKQDIFSAVTGLAGHALTLTGRGEPADVSTVAVTPGFFSVFSKKPLLGRTLLDGDGERGAAPAAVLSESLWRSRFGADPRIVGKPVTLDQRTYTVMGVMPAAFQTPFFNKAEQVWIPLAQDPLFGQWIAHPPQRHWLAIVARLRDGVSFDRAQAEMRTFTAELAQQYPEEHGWTAKIQPLQQVIVGDLKRPLLFLLCAAGLVLAIACVNIANLLLTQATARAKEIAMRIALGASRGRIVRQLQTENAILGLLGGALGTLLAWRSVPALIRFLPPGLPQLQNIHVNAAVLGFAMALSLASIVAFGMAPALYAVRSDPQTSLRGGAAAGQSRGARRVRNVLAAGEIALAALLLCGAGLLLRSFGRLLAVDPGFAADHVLKAEISLPRYQYSKPQQWSNFADQLLTRLQTRPGMENSAIAVPLPVLDNPINLPFVIAGNAPKPQGQANTADYVAATQVYFRVMGVSLLRGRTFAPDDAAQTAPVAVISESLAKQYFPHQDPLGRHMVFGFPPGGSVSREIVGVVSDVRDVSMAKAPGPVMYVPFAQAPFWGGEVVVRSGMSLSAVSEAIRTEAHAIDSNLPITNIESFPEAIDASLVFSRFRTMLVAVFGGMALLVAAIGIYGVVSFSVARRTREIGVRITMGASPAHVGRLVLGESAALALLGLAVGIPSALALTRFFSSLLFGIAPYDPLTFIAVASVLLLVTLAAAYLPARRAARLDPLEALRSE